MHICVYVCEGVVHVNAGASGGQKKVRPLELELQTVVCHWMWLWELNVGPLQEQEALLTPTPSLWVHT